MHEIEHVQVDQCVVALKHRTMGHATVLACAANVDAAREIGEALARYHHVPLRDGSGFPLSVG